MFTLASRRLPSLMCQHGMVNEDLWRSSSFDYMFILQVEDVNGSLESLGHHYLALGNCGNTRGLFQAWCPSRFSPISLHNLLFTTSDGFRSQVQCFLLIELAIVHSALWGVIFCLDFSPFFFLLLFPCWVFFLYLLFCQENFIQACDKFQLKQISQLRYCL